MYITFNFLSQQQILRAVNHYTYADV